MRTTGNGSRRGLGDSPRPSMPREPMKSKVVLLGDGGVGKTSLVRRFVVDQYSDDYITTVGTKVSKRSLNIGSPLAEVEMVMQIWDVLGQKGYSGVQETAIKGAQGVLLVYDATNGESRRALEDYWIPAVWRLAGRIPTVFAGNKSDLVPDRVWAEEYLYFLTQKYSCPGILTSAKTGDRVESSFKALGEQILQAAGHPIRRIALVTPPQEPVDRLIRVTDKIMTDFCYHMGGVETGMPIVKRQLGLAGLDVRSPTSDAIHDLIERLAVVERDFKGADETASNRERRPRVSHSRKEGPHFLPIVPTHLLGEDDPAAGKDATDFCGVQLLVTIEDEVKHVALEREMKTVGTEHLDAKGGQAALCNGSV